MYDTILLIAGHTCDFHHSKLLQAVSVLGPVITMDAEEAEAADVDKFRLVVIDASTVRRATEIVDRLKRRFPSIRLVVATAMPTWKTARALYHAGAADYLDKTLDLDDIVACLRSVLELDVCLN